MKCYFCNCETETMTNDGRFICNHCAVAKKFIVCTELGKVITITDFQCTHVCSDCEIKEDL